MSLQNASEPNADLKTAEGGAWSIGEMLAKRFALGDLARGRRRFQLAYWQDRFGGFHYPKWQFDQSMRVLPDVARILGVFRTHDTMRVLSWFVGPVAPGRKSLLDLIRAGRGDRAVAIVRQEEEANDSVPPLSRKATAELRRRLKDFEDPTRFVIGSAWTRKHVTFYDVEQDVYTVGEITPACLFRRRPTAEAVAKSLNGGKPRGLMRHIVAAVKKTPKGIRFLESLPDPFDPRKRFKPPLRAPDAAKPPLLVPLALPNTRAHFVESFLFVMENREAVAGLVANARSRSDARNRLIRECLMSPSQADAVLELRLWHFTRAECRKHRKELQDLLRSESGVEPSRAFR